MRFSTVFVATLASVVVAQDHGAHGGSAAAAPAAAGLAPASSTPKSSSPKGSYGPPDDSYDWSLDSSSSSSSSSGNGPAKIINDGQPQAPNPSVVPTSAYPAAPQNTVSTNTRTQSKTKTRTVDTYTSSARAPPAVQTGAAVINSVQAGAGFSLVAFLAALLA